ncbi:GspH/FimT family pseudopilin [Nitrincola alkalilacustris]|uniref:GspH/FimT family pseudopilin n=1 Tax=Nitrincola alkalilacustris TaxID=1571224 RepID=UPI00124D3C1A|nr:GspH/FimT family pseudopilin [Nitrincola alkalilacustris]
MIVSRRTAAGFTLLELMVALAIAGLLAAVSAPSALKMYESMQYRGAVRDMQTLLATARYQAISAGRMVDLVVMPETGHYGLDHQLNRELPSTLTIEMISAREVSGGDGQGVVRFYPDGGSSGGSIMLRQRDSDKGVRLRVDWLLGRVTQEPWSP